MLSTFRSILGFRETTVNQYFNIIVRNATKKSGGSSKNGRDSKGKRLGVKKHHKESVIPGNIIIRQRGKTFDNGEGVGLGKDYTIYSLIEGVVNFKFNKNRKKQVVSVFPHGTILPVKPVPQKRPINRGYGVFNIKPHGTVLPGKPVPEKQPINRGDSALNVKQAQQ